MRRVRKQVNRARRGHNFYPPLEVERKIPALGATDNPDMDVEDTIVYLHYFSPSADWYVTEWNPVTGEAFGWAELLPGCGEWGYMSLPELESIYIPPFTIIERDMYWDPKPMSAVLKERAGR
jgi:hypothetical protein